MALRLFSDIVVFVVVAVVVVVAAAAAVIVALLYTPVDYLSWSMITWRCS